MLTSFAFAKNTEKTILPEKISDSRNLSLKKSLTWDENLGTCTVVITFYDEDGKYLFSLVRSTDYIYSEEGCAIWAQVIFNLVKSELAG